MVRNYPESLADAVALRLGNEKIVFVRPLRSEGAAMLALFNGASVEGSLAVRWDEIPAMGWGDTTLLRTEDVWTGKMGEEKGGLSATVAPHGTAVVWVKET